MGASLEWGWIGAGAEAGSGAVGLGAGAGAGLDWAVLGWAGGRDGCVCVCGPWHRLLGRLLTF